MPELPSGKPVAFATSKEHPNLTPNDQLAVEAFRERGIVVVPAIWNDYDVQWSDYSATIVRSTWDYFLDPPRFNEWLNILERSGTSVWNPLRTLRWNLDKHYLLDLGKRGFAIPRTVYIEQSGSFDPVSLKSELGLDEVVVKPVVSASAWRTMRIRLTAITDDEMHAVAGILGSSGIMVQEFMPEIEEEGEWSLLFFGETFSHAVRKRPANGDFRVQEELGGSYAPAIPPEELLRQAEAIVRSVEGELLYARVDGIFRSSRLILMELELLEPALFFEVNEEAPFAFCERFIRLSTPK